MENLIYHICKLQEWKNVDKNSDYSGSSQDQEDGFIHFSTAEQVIESAYKHRKGQSNLILLTVKSQLLGSNLKWEQSRGGQLFPHLYGNLPKKAVLKVEKLKLGKNGRHIFPKSFLK